MDIKNWLGTRITHSDWIYIDYWSVLHFIWGWVLYAKFNVWLALVIIIGYELIEPYFIGFKPEGNIDTVWDIIITFVGYLAAGGYASW